ncbi:hypothetical protein KO527_05310 [Pseudoalteromonas sp. C2R02]|uniref:hypothetical protein n=1 Tax=Pseudoalteromonas sp. C2R02 TaxID=2841565 RepID=UPI001C08549D|nr:hypothetical protein [Pseudoalteromonas sp. C2R02]MBU2968766.1 hypothetical protein [Pseudoalteromonas sp. C2R02]
MKRRKLDLRADAYSSAADALFLIAGDCGNEEKAKEFEFVAKKLDREAHRLLNAKES